MISSLIDRFTSKIQKTGTCWLWKGTRLKDGYGQFWASGKHVYAHRFSYEMHVGPILPGVCLDHICRVRNCVNPEHLEPVTIQENIRRGELWKVSGAKVHCPKGHPYNKANTYQWRNERQCRICICDRAREFRRAYPERVAKIKKAYRSRRRSEAMTQ